MLLARQRCGRIVVHTSSFLGLIGVRDKTLGALSIASSNDI